MSALRLYSVALVFAAWAAFWTVGLQSDALAGVMITLAVVLHIRVAHRERQRLVWLHRGGYRRREDDT